MIQKLKQILYFPVAGYFRFWARLQFNRWNPRVVLVTGSSGKTTLLHMLESQIGKRAHYSHHANSAFGIPFDILGFPPRSNAKSEWIDLFITAPFRAFKKPLNESIYVVEADSDRPGEAEFISSLVKPEVTIWLSSDKSHSYNFDSQVADGLFLDVREAIAYEFGAYLAAAAKLAIINDSEALIINQGDRTSAKIEAVRPDTITGYAIKADHTVFKIDGTTYTVPGLVPQEAGLSMAAVVEACRYLGIEVDKKFSSFIAPPGRSTVFKGIKKTTLIDSTYNAIPDAVRAVLGLFAKYPGKPKWLVISDMLEQGDSEADEHRAIAESIAKLNLDRIILMGPRMSKYTAPRLKELLGDKAPIEVFLKPRPVLDYLQNHLKGGEIILFKGSRFLDGVVEHLLSDPSDEAKLCRRGPVWQRRREQWEL
ncbi:MAG TPA: cyanophycin synthetase [Candidatus Saccharimonadia bacterium]